MRRLQILARRWKDESGISSGEYVLVLAFIVVGFIIVTDILGNTDENAMIGTAGCIEDTSGCSLYAFPANTFPQ